MFVYWLTQLHVSRFVCPTWKHVIKVNRKRASNVTSVCSPSWQVQAMNEVSALSPFPARYTSINFTTSQSGEHRTERMKRWDEREEMLWLCVRIDTVCVLCVCLSACLSVCLGFVSPLFSFSFSPSFLLPLSEQEVARGYNILSDPIRVTV